MKVQLDGKELGRMTIGERVKVDDQSHDGEIFIVTKFDRFTLFVSTKYGFAYTRPQLVKKYSNVSDVAEILS